jgi:Zn-dependent alcohol dehydrogenase
MAQETQAVVIHAPHDLRIDRVAVPDLGASDVAVKIQRGGICGSDLHYYHDGGFGAVRLKEPMVLGHEISGTVSAIGTVVKAVKIGDRVAVNPSLPCGVCRSMGMSNMSRVMPSFRHRSMVTAQSARPRKARSTLVTTTESPAESLSHMALPCGRSRSRTL